MPEMAVGIPMTIPPNVESPPRYFAYSLDDETTTKNESCKKQLQRIMMMSEERFGSLSSWSSAASCVLSRGAMASSTAAEDAALGSGLVCLILGARSMVERGRINRRRKSAATVV